MRLISYIAWEPPTGVLDGFTFEVKRTIDIRRDRFQTLPFGAAFVEAPVFLADIQATGRG